MASRPYRWLIVVGVALFLAAETCRASFACPFCSMQGQTLIGDVNQASMVLYGIFTNAKLDPNGDGTQGTTDLVIEKVIKKNDILGDRKVLTLPRYVPVDSKSKQKFLVFCDVFKGKIDPYRGVPVPGRQRHGQVLTGALEARTRDIGKRLRFFFDYLDDSDNEVSTDAYKEFGNADYKDYREMAKQLPAEKIAKWLQDSEHSSLPLRPVRLDARPLRDGETRPDAAQTAR